MLKTVEDVLGRMYNWKMTSAYEYAFRCPAVPDTALLLLHELSKKFGNCGWCDGAVFDELRDKNNEVALLLGYKWSDADDDWVPTTERKTKKSS